MPTIEELKQMNKKQLYDYCRANKIKGYSNMNKAYINNLILQHKKKGKQPKNKILTDIGVKWEDTDELVNQIKVGKTIEFSDFDKSGMSKRFKGKISRIGYESGSIFVKHDNQEKSVGFAFWKNDDNDLYYLVFSSSRIRSFSRGMMKMIKKSGGKRSPFSK